MRTFALTLSLVIAMNASQAQSIDANRMVDWSVVGLKPIQKSSTRVSVLDFGAKGNGLSDDSEAVIKAIKSLGKEGGEVFFPKGNYLIKKGLVLDSRVVLNGAGSDMTKLLFDSGSKEFNCISVGALPPKTFKTLKQAPKKGDTTIPIDEASDFKIGDYVELRQENGSWDKKPRDWAKYSVGQILRVKNVNSDGIVIEQPIRIDYNLSLKPEIGVFEPKTDVGIQNLAIERLNQPAKGLNMNIQFRYAVNCWVKGVEGIKSVGSHVMISICSNIEVSGCYFHHAFDYSGSGTKGYGVTLIRHSGECLIENNVFSNLRHAMMVKQGANGNVFAYNYSFEPTRKELISNYSGDISMHGHYPFANLFEGNIVHNIMVDKYWGASGPDNTLFRNRVMLYGIIYSPTAGNYHNIVGNEVTNRSFFMGKVLLPGTGHLIKGNAVGAKSNQSIEEQSLYLKSKPKFWTAPIPFPSIGTPNYNTSTIPAYERAQASKPWTVYYKN